MKKLTLACFIGLVVLSGCATGQNSDTLLGRWELTEFDGEPIPQDAYMEGMFPFISFIEEGERVTGSTGCNTFNGVVNLEESGTIDIQKLAMTMMFCELYIDENLFTKTLEERVARYRVKGDLLTFYNSEGEAVALFKKAPL